MVEKSKKNLSKSQMHVVIIMTVAVIVAAAVFAVLLYINDYYKATEKAKKAILGNAKVSVRMEDGYYVFSALTSEETVKKGIIFYPGGKVEETAYAPLLLSLAEEGYEGYLVQMPARLAVFGVNAAQKIMQDAPEIGEWTLMGHSLGGAMAASFTASHEELVDNLVLLAAYSTKDLRGLDVDVYSFYGSEDKVLNMEKYEKYRSNLPENAVETVIDGGNHSYYAHYGEQAGDGTATITREEQQETVKDIFFNGEYEDGRN